LAESVLAEERQFRCPGCERVLDGSSLRPGEPFKCARCKKLLTFGPHLWDSRAAARWRALRLVVLLACVASTVWCLMVGYEMGARTEQWVAGFGGALAVWMVSAGCVALAALTTQNNGVVVGVTAIMSGVMLFFVQRLGRYVHYDLGAWEQFRFHRWWVPVLLVVGAGVLAASLVMQGRRRSV
jgi:uncharacterized paraquat-inducible protein A